MNYAEYVPTPAEWFEIHTNHRLDELIGHEQLLHDLLAMGRELITVQKRKADVQSVQLAGDIRDIDLRRYQDLTIPFDRLARGIRMAIQLHQKILDLLIPSPVEPPSPAKTDQPTRPDGLDDVTRQPPEQIIAKACENLAAALDPNITLPDTGPRAALETLRAHLATLTGGEIQEADRLLSNDRTG
jgi:hypothetical protein